MKCVSNSQLLRVQAGKASAEELRELDDHLARCARCAALRGEIDAMAKRLAPDPDEFHAPEFASEVMTLIRTGRADREFGRPARRPWSGWRSWLAVPAAAAAAAVLLLFVWPRFDIERAERFQARGGLRETPDRWVSLRIYRRANRGYKLVERDLKSSDALAFSYLNRAPSSFRYLMIFAVDSRGRVFWYYPAYVDRNQNPASIEIHTSSRLTELPDQVRHEWAVGALRIFGLFSKTPLEVQTVEKLVTRQLAEVKTVDRLRRIKIAGVGQHTSLLQIAAEPKID